MTSVSKDPSSNDISNEESGWTTYFEDFSNNNNIDDNNQHKSSLSLSRVASSSSLVSDATSSLIEKNVAHIVEDEEEVSVNKNGKESSFKKRKNITDDALEDTATSPLNSPKVKFNFLLLLFLFFHYLLFLSNKCFIFIKNYLVILYI